MFQIFRELFKPAYSYLTREEYREWISVKSACRKKAKGTSVTFSIAGFIVTGNDASAFQHQYEEIFVNRCFEIDFNKKNPLIFCCGANIGLELFFFKKHFPESRIKAFEADPEIALILKENVSKNNLEQVEVFASAVWNTEGEISFQSDGALGGKTGSGNKSVQTIRLANWLAQESHIDLVIMDIEGAESLVLMDCREQLSKVDNLFVEWHGAEIEEQKLPEFLLLLTSCGFRYRLNNKLPIAPFNNRIIENGFDSMVEIYATRH